VTVVWLFVVVIIVWAIVICTCITLAISVAHWGVPSVRLCLLRRLLLVLHPVLVGVVLPAGAAEVAVGEVGNPGTVPEWGLSLFSSHDIC
jgi:hypothetical protein